MEGNTMNIAVINAITGGFDERKDFPAQLLKGFEHYAYYHFTENDFPVEHAGLNNRTKALFFKTQMHKLIKADFYIWIDGKIQVDSVNFIAELISQLGNNDFAMLKHGSRNCIYVEANYIQMMVNKGNKYLTDRYGKRNVLNQVQQYRKAGYPPNNGLHDCSIFIWRNTVFMQAFMDRWWNMIKDEITFDQTAVQYLAWINNMKIKSLELKPEMFHLVKHLL